MPKYEVLITLKHDGKIYQPGTQITLVKKQADKLILNGTIKTCKTNEINENETNETKTGGTKE